MQTELDDAGVFKLYLVKTLAILVLPQLEATHWKAKIYSGCVHTIRENFSAGAKKIPDRASVHTAPTNQSLK